MEYTWIDTRRTWKVYIGLLGWHIGMTVENHWDIWAYWKYSGGLLYGLLGGTLLWHPFHPQPNISSLEGPDQLLEFWCIGSAWPHSERTKLEFSTGYLESRFEIFAFGHVPQTYFSPIILEIYNWIDIELIWIVLQ
jgi:hypothetical protein